MEKITQRHSQFELIKLRKLRWTMYGRTHEITLWRGRRIMKDNIKLDC